MNLRDVLALQSNQKPGHPPSNMVWCMLPPRNYLLDPSSIRARPLAPLGRLAQMYFSGPQHPKAKTSSGLWHQSSPRRCTPSPGGTPKPRMAIPWHECLILGGNTSIFDVFLSISQTPPSPPPHFPPACEQLWGRPKTVEGHQVSFEGHHPLACPKWAYIFGRCLGGSTPHLARYNDHASISTGLFFKTNFGHPKRIHPYINQRHYQLNTLKPTYPRSTNLTGGFHVSGQGDT